MPWEFVGDFGLLQGLKDAGDKKEQWVDDNEHSGNEEPVGESRY